MILVRIVFRPYQVKNVPPIAKVLSAERGELENGFEGKKGGENFVPKVENVLQLCTHPVVLDGEEDGVKDDAEGDDDIEEGVVNDGKEDVLGFEPAGVVKATCPTAGTVAIVSSFWKILQMSKISKLFRRATTMAITGILILCISVLIIAAIVLVIIVGNRINHHHCDNHR